MPFMTRIPSDLARFGLKVELVPGWETRGSSSFAPGCVVDHWTAGPRGTTGRPSLNIVVNGRTGLPGPLANVYLARDGVCVVVAAGRANHAGTGGFRGLVGNSAAYGIEAESGGDGDWTPAMLDAYPRLNAALLSGLGRDASWLCGHHEWTPRKIDIRDVIGTVRARTAAALANPQEDDMFTDDDRRLLGALVYAVVPEGGLREPAGAVVNRLGALQYVTGEDGEIVKRLRAIHGLVSDPAAFADAVVKRLPESGSGDAGSLTADDVKGAVRDVLGSLNDA